MGTNFRTNVLTAALELVQRWAQDDNIARETWPRANHIVVLGKVSKKPGRGWPQEHFVDSVRAALVAVQIWLQKLRFPSKTEHDTWSRNTAKLAETFKDTKRDIYDWIQTEVSKLIPQWNTDKELIEGADRNGRDWSAQVRAESRRKKKGKVMARTVVVDKEGDALSPESDVTVLLTAYTMLRAMTRSLRNDVPLDSYAPHVEFEIAEGIFMAASYAPLVNPDMCHGAFTMDRTSARANSCVLHALVTLSTRCKIDWANVNSNQRLEERCVSLLVSQSWSLSLSLAISLSLLQFLSLDLSLSLLQFLCLNLSLTWSLSHTHTHTHTQTHTHTLSLSLFLSVSHTHSHSHAQSVFAANDACSLFQLGTTTMRRIMRYQRYICIRICIYVCVCTYMLCMCE